MGARFVQLSSSVEMGISRAEEARKLQSGHWLTRGYTLFIAVVSWVRVPEWNKINVGLLTRE